MSPFPIVVLLPRKYVYFELDTKDSNYAIELVMAGGYNKLNTF